MLENILAFDINIFACFLLLTMMIIIRIKGDRHSFSSTLFVSIICLTIAALFLEAVSWIADAYSGGFAFFANYLSNWLLVLVTPVLAGFWISYVDYKILQNRKRIAKLHYYQFGTYFVLVTLVLNFFFPIHFIIAPDNEYAPGTFGWINNALMYLHIVYAAALTVKFRGKTNIGVIRGVMAVFILPVIGTIIQSFYNRFLFTWPMLALAVVVTYMFLETTSGTLDRLTNLYSRAKFDEYVHFIKERGELFGLIMIDLDDFKAVNDNYGHQAGDVVLTEFARILKQVFRSERMVARIGGDEFMVVTYHDANAAGKSVTAVRDVMGRLKKIPALKTLRFSYGFIQNTPELSIDDLLSKVDHRMYDDKAKNKGIPPTNGRNILS